MKAINNFIIEKLNKINSKNTNNYNCDEYYLIGHYTSSTFDMLWKKFKNQNRVIHFNLGYTGFILGFILSVDEIRNLFSKSNYFRTFRIGKFKDSEINNYNKIEDVQQHYDFKCKMEEAVKFIEDKNDPELDEIFK